MLYNYTTFHKKKSLYHYKNTSIPLIRKMQTSLNYLLFHSPCTGGTSYALNPQLFISLSRPSDYYANTLLCPYHIATYCIHILWFLHGYPDREAMSLWVFNVECLGFRAKSIWGFVCRAFAMSWLPR